MKFAIGSDHAGFDLKEKLKKYLEEKGHQVIDKGTLTKESTDYPEYGKKVGLAVASGEVELGFLVCGSGIGISIAANKVHGARAANCTNVTMARLCRQHNNANILAMGERIVGDEVAYDMVDIFLATTFEGGRHARRVAKIED